MTEIETDSRVEERWSGFRIFALFLAVGLIALGFTWMTVNERSVARLSGAFLPIHSHTAIMRWIEHGYFASHGLLWPVPGEKIIYRSQSGGLMISGFLVEKIWITLTGHYGWRLLALHNQIVSLLTSALFALLAFRLARRLSVDSLRAFVLGAGAQMVWFTFPGSLEAFWGLSEEAYFLSFALCFLLVEERARNGGRTRRLAILQALAAFAMTYMEYIAGTMFLASYAATVLLLRDEESSPRRLAVTLLLPWMCALGIYGLQLISARSERSQTGTKLVGSSFVYRTGLDGDAMFYGTHLDIAYGRDVVRGPEPERQFLFRWPWLFACGVASVLATFAASISGRAPRSAGIALSALLGSYLLYAAVFSQAVVLHPYHFDLMLVTPLILALFAIVPALLESLTRRTGTFVLVALLAATCLSMFQLRIYALSYPAPQPAVARAS
jgi:hypothetical protein